MKHFLARTKNFKGKVAIVELRRAHMVIALLSITLGFVLIMNSSYSVQLDMTLSITAAVLLALVALISVAIVFALSKKV